MDESVKKKATGTEVDNEPSVWKSFFADKRAIYVLFVMTLVFVHNQLNRYVFGPIANQLEEGIGFGDGTGESFEYGMLTGPISTIPYCIGVAFLTPLADHYNKIYIFTAMLVWWSLTSGLIVLTTSYWQLATLRALMVFGSSSAIAIGSVIVADHFPQNSRGVAIGIYGWGVPVGLGIGYGVGNYLADEIGYRGALIICSAWGLPLALLVFCTIKERRHKISFDILSDESVSKTSSPKTAGTSTESTFAAAPKPMGVKEILVHVWEDKVLLLIFISSSFRQVSQLNWIYFKIQFFENYHGMSKTEIAQFLSWEPIVGGIAGAVIFGWWADRLSAKHGALGRCIVLTVIMAVNVPVILGVLYIPVLWTFIVVMIDEILTGYWTPGIVAATIHISPPQMRVSAAGYLFLFSTFVGGNSTLLAPIIADAFEKAGVDENQSLHLSLHFLYLGGMVLASVLMCGATFLQYKKQIQERKDSKELEVIVS